MMENCQDRSSTPPLSLLLMCSKDEGIALKLSPALGKQEKKGKKNLGRRTMAKTVCRISSVKCVTIGNQF